jgi:hypothetical protein
MIVKAEGPSGRAKIHSDEPKHALGLVQYLRTIGYSAWIEDTNGNEIDEKALKIAIRSRHEDAPPFWCSSPPRISRRAMSAVCNAARFFGRTSNQGQGQTLGWIL